MQNKLIYTLTIASCLLLQACSFNTTNRSISPYFDGVLKFNNEPIKNASIMLSLNSADSQCHMATQTTTTDETGKFSLKAAMKQQKYKPFVNFQLDEWVVCAKHDNQRYTLYSNNRYDLGNVTESVYLDCDLALRPLSRPCKASTNQ